MSKNPFKRHILFKKICATLIIIAIYLVGRSIPLYGIDTTVREIEAVSAEQILKQALSGDAYKYSIFALGITPYMTTSIVMMIIMSLLGKEKRSKISTKKMNILQMYFMLALAGLQSIIQIKKFVVLSGYDEFLSNILCFAGMVTGAVVILILCERNKKFGIGGQTAIICVNIVDGFIKNVGDHSIDELQLPLVLGIVAMGIAFFMELKQRKIEVLKISIHNIYADKNYMALKYNPIGIMPMMFATSILTLFQLLETGVQYIWPKSSKIQWLIDNTVLTRLFGVCFYIFIIYLLNFVFTRIMMNPKELTENYLKSGDCLANIHPGRDTRKYLSRTINVLCLISSTVMSVCVGIPLFMQLDRKIPADLSMLPTSIMMLTGLCCAIGQEAYATIKNDSYKSIF